MARRRTELVKADAADTELLPLVPEPVGIELLDGGEAPTGAEVLSGHGGPPARRPEEVLAEPPDARDISAELAAPPRRKLPWLTLVLSAGVVAAAAFAGGALVEKQHLQNTPTAAGRGFTFSGGTGTGSRTGAGGGTGARTGAGAATGTGAGTGTGTGAAGGTSAGSGVTFGTVKLVDGKTLYVTDAQGNIVKVTTGGSTTVTVSKDGKVTDLQPGQTVTVRGNQNSDGDIAATTVTQGGPTGGGGFGGFGGFGTGGTGGRTSGN